MCQQRCHDCGCFLVDKHSGESISSSDKGSKKQEMERDVARLSSSVASKRHQSGSTIGKEQI